MTDLHLYAQRRILISLENDKSTYCDASFSLYNRIVKDETPRADNTTALLA